MAKFYPALNAELRQFIARQHLFFVATAPHTGRINLSPKGMDTFRVLDDHHVAYLDLTGSGNETAAHLRENQRMTFMFCSFDADPLILRLYGQGHSIYPRDSGWPALIAQFPPRPGSRQIVVTALDSLQTSCGFGVPRYDWAGDRDTLGQWTEKKGGEGVRQYWREKNQTSIDGQPTGLPDD